MAALPDYVVVLLDGYSDQFDPGVTASDMERGLPKLRVSQSRVVASIHATFVFQGRADAAAFEAWYFDTIGRIGWFDFTDPRTSTVRTVRLQGGALGPLEAMAPLYGLSRRTAVLEYLR